MNETSTGRTFPIYAAVDSAKTPTAKTTFDTRVAAIPATTNFFSDRYGPYPFDSTGAVADIAPDVGYALENQTKPHYAGSATNMFSASTQAHEIAHQWMGDAVGPATWREIWFNEGWADFSATLFNNNADEAAMQAYFDNNYNNVRQRLVGAARGAARARGAVHHLPRLPPPRGHARGLPRDRRRPSPSTTSRRACSMTTATT